MIRLIQPQRPAQAVAVLPVPTAETPETSAKQSQPNPTETPLKVRRAVGGAE